MGRNIAIILAGGSGSRMGVDVPKQFLEIEGRTILEYSVEAFESHPDIDAIAIISRSDYIEKVRNIVSRRGFQKVEKILPGGKERYHSSLAAIGVYEDDDILLFHDAVRPLVSKRIIDDCLAAMEKYNAVDVAFNTTDTIIQVDSGNCICAIPDRTFLRNGQTPQCFRRSIIAKAYNVALADPRFKTTDDCGVVLRYLPEESVYVVQGDVTNMKVTYKEDLEQIQRLLRRRELI
ncbi:MAG: 2-C-methyl-D-erythritol 4-phosphate cytidylyltransferase [Candidatus Cryptobacteroides sp.]